MNYIGIDPGIGGGLASIFNRGFTHAFKFHDKSMAVLWNTIRYYSMVPKTEITVYIEEQLPRPTRWTDKETSEPRSSILRSTCILYGEYCKMVAWLTAGEIHFTTVQPKMWQKAHGLFREKGEKEVSWKNRLVDKARELFPKVKVTHYIADALLIANFARIKVGRAERKKGTLA